MDANEIIEKIRRAEKKTPVKVMLRLKEEVAFEGCHVFGGPEGMTVFGDWKVIEPVLQANRDRIVDMVLECDRRNSALPLLDLKQIDARIEPGAVIRDQVDIGHGAVIMMGAIINIGAVIGEGTMIDMGAVLGGRAIVGKNSHVGAGAVLAGVVEPPSAKPVTVGDNVLIGANAVVIACHQDAGRGHGCQDHAGGCASGTVTYEPCRQADAGTAGSLYEKLKDREGRRDRRWRRRMSFRSPGLSGLTSRRTRRRKLSASST